MGDHNQIPPRGRRGEDPDLEEVRRKIAVGLEQLDRGEGLVGETVFDELLGEHGAGSAEQ